MPCNFQCEAIAKFLIPNRPQEDNYPDPNEFEEKEKEWMEQWDQALACCAAWVERGQLAGNRCVQEAACGAVGRTRIGQEAAEHKVEVVGQKKVGAVGEVMSNRKA